MSKTYKTLTSSKIERRSVLPQRARLAYVLNALLAELEWVKRETVSKEISGKLNRAEELLCEIFEYLGSSIPLEYTAAKAGDATVQTMLTTIEKIEYMYLEELNGMAEPYTNE